MNNIKSRFRIKKCTIGCANSREFITFVRTNRSKGGTNSSSNAQVLSKEENLKKSNRY